MWGGVSMKSCSLSDKAALCACQAITQLALMDSEKKKKKASKKNTSWWLMINPWWRMGFNAWLFPKVWINSPLLWNKSCRFLNDQPTVESFIPGGKTGFSFCESCLLVEHVCFVFLFFKKGNLFQQQKGSKKEVKLKGWWTFPESPEAIKIFCLALQNEPLPPTLLRSPVLSNQAAFPC